MNKIDKLIEVLETIKSLEAEKKSLVEQLATENELQLVTLKTIVLEGESGKKIQMTRKDQFSIDRKKVETLPPEGRELIERVETATVNDPNGLRQTLLQLGLNESEVSLVEKAFLKRKVSFRYKLNEVVGSVRAAVKRFSPQVKIL